jgi:deoxyribonuclease-4
MTAKVAKKVQSANRPRFGVHVSVAGGLENGIAEGVRLGCDCIQIFVKNQRQWRNAPLTAAQTQAFRAAHSASALTPIIAHANYLLNLASPAETTRSMSIDVLTDELNRCEALGVEGLVLHPGSHLQDAEKSKRRHAETDNQSWERKRLDAVFPSRDREEAGAVAQNPERQRAGLSDAYDQGIERIAAGLDEVHRRCAGFRSMVLLETTAGQGTNIGWRFEQLRSILDRVREPDRLGVCLDTCHLFAAGYDFRTPETYAATIDELDRVIGVAQVKCIHTNDSKKALGSRVDRHEHIGKGEIGSSGFAQFVNDPRFGSIPMILETPKGTNARGQDLDQLNLTRLRSLISGF